MNHTYMTAAQISAALPLVSYKPGWVFSLHEQPHDGFPYEGLCLDISFEVPDTYHAGRMQQQNVHVPVPPLVDADHLHDFLMWRLARIETHELREFFKVSGIIRDDPHREELKVL